MIDKFDLGDIVEMKKQHPCGSKEFEVIRLGADIKIKCVECGRIIMLPRIDFNKKIKKNPQKVLTKPRVCGIILNVAGKDGQATGA